MVDPMSPYSLGSPAKKDSATESEVGTAERQLSAYMHGMLRIVRALNSLSLSDEYTALGGSVKRMPLALEHTRHISSFHDGSVVHLGYAKTAPIP